MSTKVVQTSLRFDTKPETRTRDFVLDVLDETKADLQPTTELYGAAPLIRKALPAGYKMRKQGEYGLLLSDRYRVTSFSHTRRSHVWVGNSDWRDLYTARWSLWDEEDDLPTVIDVGHLASTVEKGTKWNPHEPKRVRTNQEGQQNWGASLHRVQRRRPRALVLASADFNLNFREQAWIDVVEHNLHLECAWDKFPPKRGSHTNRTIDATFHNGITRGAHVVNINPPGDHHAVVCTIQRKAA